MHTSRSLDILTDAIQRHLHVNELLSDTDPLWTIASSPLGGFGIFALQDIPSNQIVFEDIPIITGPRVNKNCPLACVNCYNTENLVICQNGCGLLICANNKCQISSQHQSECAQLRIWWERSNMQPSQMPTEDLMRCLTPIRGLFLGPEKAIFVTLLKANKNLQDKCEIDVLRDSMGIQLDAKESHFLRLLCCVLNTNAFEIDLKSKSNPNEPVQAEAPSIRGLYPLSSLANHSCVPNVEYSVDSNYKMTVRTTKSIQNGDEVLISYCPLLWGTTVRRFHLYNTKSFLCKCERCLDPSEFGTFLSAMKCNQCKDGQIIHTNYTNLIPKNWKCNNEQCTNTKTALEVGQLSTTLGSVLQSLNCQNVEFIVKFISRISGSLVSEGNEIVVQLKLRVIGILQNNINSSAEDSKNKESLLLLQISYCTDLLDLLIGLKMGECRLKTYLMHEKYKCEEEISEMKKTTTILDSGI